MKTFAEAQKKGEAFQVKEQNCKIMKLVSLLLIMSLLVLTFSGCDISSKHLEVTYEKNDNENLTGWDDIAADNTTTWDNADITSWSDVDEYSEWVYSSLVFEDIQDEMPLIDCVVLDYQTSGQYFDGEKVYQLVGDKFDVNSFIAKYAVGTGVIIICVVLTVTTAGGSTPVVCFFAGAADYSIPMAVKGSAFGAASKAVIRAINSDGDFEETLYGALEGSSDGYMWGAIYGAATGGFSSKYCFTGDTPVHTSNGVIPIGLITAGDQVLSFHEKTNEYTYETVTQVSEGVADEFIVISTTDDIITSTPSHFFLTASGWKPAGELNEKDYLINGNMDKKKVLSLSRRKYSEPVKIYSLCVENAHTYTVGHSQIIVHNRCMPNQEYADKRRYFEEGSDLAKKYPEGVPYKPSGHPDFSDYAIKTVSFQPSTQAGVEAGVCLRGDCYYDFKMANKAAFGIDSVTATPKGYTWHHCEDGVTMQLIPTDLHRAIGHDGGEKVIRLLLSGL